MSITVAVSKQADHLASLSFPINHSTGWKDKVLNPKTPSQLSISPSPSSSSSSSSSSSTTTRSNNMLSLALATCFPTREIVINNPDQHHQLCRRPVVNFPDGPLIFNSPWRHRKEKVVIVMGATGTGKSKLSIDLATQFNAEVVNSDKIQVYKGLDIVTNKITEDERLGVQHHLLGEIRPDDDFTAAHFRLSASRAVASIAKRNRLPIIAGGSNSFIEALVDGDDRKFRTLFDCCFIWVDVALPVLCPFLSHRIDKMVESGLVDEVRKFFKPEADYNRGIRRAIGVPELDLFLRAERRFESEEKLNELLEMGIGETKVKTCELACRQLKKIRRLHGKWNVHRIDATEVFRCRGGRGVEDTWQRVVAAPTARLVEKFLYEDEAANVPRVVATTPVLAAKH